VTAALFDLSGRRALVTGSSKGIGAALAAGLAGAGAEVVLNGRDTGALTRARDELAGRTGRGCMPSPRRDRPAAVDAGLREAEEAAGPLDILVNNAGTILREPMLRVPVADWRDLLTPI